MPCQHGRIERDLLEFQEVKFLLCCIPKRGRTSATSFSFHNLVIDLSCLKKKNSMCLLSIESYLLNHEFVYYVLNLVYEVLNLFYEVLNLVY
jgi:hypothetical protein